MNALTQEALESNWGSVELVANALLANGRIVKGQEIKAMLGAPARPQGYTVDAVCLMVPEVIRL